MGGAPGLWIHQEVRHSLCSQETYTLLELSGEFAEEWTYDPEYKSIPPALSYNSMRQAESFTSITRMKKLNLSVVKSLARAPHICVLDLP